MISLKRSEGWVTWCLPVQGKVIMSLTRPGLWNMKNGGGYPSHDASEFLFEECEAPFDVLEVFSAGENDFS